MAHRRKLYVVYSPEYKPGEGKGLFRCSLYQAKKLALKFGVGSCIWVQIHTHKTRQVDWAYSEFKFLMEVIKQEKQHDN